MTESTQKCDELCAALENAKIKELKKQVRKLEAEKEILKERVETLENQIKELKRKKMSDKEKEILRERVETVEDQLKELKDDLQKAKRKNMSSDREIKNLKDKLVDVKEESRTLHSNTLVAATERQTLQLDVRDLKKSYSSLQNRVQKLEINTTTLQRNTTTLQKSVKKLEINTTTLQRKVEDLESKIHGPYDDLILSELCCCVQSMIFQKILPKGYYNETASYMIRDLDDKDFFPALFKNDKRKISEANEAWRKLQKKLKWQDEDVRRMAVAMRVIQRGRNEVAHPEITEDKLTALIQRMKDAGKVNGFHSADMVTQLTKVWKQLNSMS